MSTTTLHHSRDTSNSECNLGSIDSVFNIPVHVQMYIEKLEKQLFLIFTFYAIVNIKKNILKSAPSLTG